LQNAVPSSKGEERIGDADGVAVLAVSSTTL
jgi:hypothetical protein